MDSVLPGGTEERTVQRQLRGPDLGGVSSKLRRADRPGRVRRRAWSGALPVNYGARRRHRLPDRRGLEPVGLHRRRPRRLRSRRDRRAAARGWSVLATGIVRLVADETELRSLQRLGSLPGPKVPRTQYVRITRAGHRRSSPSRRRRPTERAAPRHSEEGPGCSSPSFATACCRT